MKKLLFSLAFVLFGHQALWAQQPVTAATPPDADPVVKISTNLIQIDVTVTDKSGKVVTGLTAADFQVLENGEAQRISDLTFISKSAGSASVSQGEGGANGTSDAAGKATAASTRRTIAIVVDDLNLSFGSVYYLRKALRTFVDSQMDPTDLVAIIRTGVGVGALQQFTTNKTVLHAAIDRIRWNALGSGGADSLASVGQNAQEISERFTIESDGVANKAEGGEKKGFRGTLLHENISDKKATDKELAQRSGEFEAGLHSQTTIGAMKYIVGGMGELPGRKAMMLFSDGLQINPDTSKSRSSVVNSLLRDLIDYANRSSVVVYTFDTKGMRSMSTQASDSSYEVIDGHRSEKERIRLDTFRESQDGLAMLAKETGGKSLLNSDDLNYGLKRALDEQTGYYLLAYAPDADTFDPAERRFNKLEVKVNRPGLKVSYRSGFFNSPTDSTASSEPAVVERTLATALTSPFSRSDIAVDINALYADDAKDGAYLRSFLHIDANALTFTEDAEGWKKASFDVAAVTFGDNGMAKDHAESKYTIRAKGPTYDSILKKGFIYVLVLPVKTPGLLQYRVAVRDQASGKVGSASQIIQVPDLTKKKLAISSLAVENVSLAVWNDMAAGKIGNGPGQTKVASTLPYDTVLKQFPAGTVLRYGYEVYNAKPDSGGRPRLEVQTRVTQNNKVMIAGTLTKVDTANQPDPAHVRVSGAMMLKEPLPPGDYVLEAIVFDTAAKKSETQLFPFEIIK